MVHVHSCRIAYSPHILRVQPGTIASHLVTVAVALALCLHCTVALLYHRGSARKHHRSAHMVEEATGYPLLGSEDIMSQKEHGTCHQAVMPELRWGCSVREADNICCFNRHYAERSGYWLRTNFLKEVDKSGELTFYDSVTGKPLFIAPRGRTFSEFEEESRDHGWPSFRDEEVIWENVRCLSNGEAVSLHGTHLGHNLPDRKGNRYCINLVAIAGLEPPMP